MGSVQQIIMGATCLVAAFFFGSYLHNRPASTQQIDQGQRSPDEPLESIFLFGQSNSNAKSDGHSLPQSTNPAISSDLPTFQSQPVVSEANSAIEASERVGHSNRVAIKDQSVRSIRKQDKPSQDAETLQKPNVPDFSDIAARFRGTELELDDQTRATETAHSAIHESERIGGFTIDDAPEVVIRQPRKLTPLQEFKNQVDRRESESNSSAGSADLAADQDPSRWRVNQNDQIDRLRREGLSPQPDTQPRKSIEDIIAEDSANYLLDSQTPESSLATEPNPDDWAANQRMEITRQAANRGRDILDIDDPGRRFHSVLNPPKSAALPQTRPAAVYETDYYPPPNPDRIQDDSLDQMRRIPRRKTQWKSRSNLQSGFKANSYRIRRGDTLQSISVRFYGVPDHYLTIYKANRDVLDRITASPEGVEIEIPSLNN